MHNQKLVFSPSFFLIFKFNLLYNTLNTVIIHAYFTLQYSTLDRIKLPATTRNIASTVRIARR